MAPSVANHNFPPSIYIPKPADKAYYEIYR